MKRTNRFGGLNRGGYGLPPDTTAYSNDEIILRNADMHRSRYGRMSDDALMMKQENATNEALLGLIVEELVKRGLR